MLEPIDESNAAVFQTSAFFESTGYFLKFWKLKNPRLKYKSGSYPWENADLIGLTNVESELDSETEGRKKMWILGPTNVVSESDTEPQGPKKRGLNLDPQHW